jgi:hypothetical protein
MCHPWRSRPATTSSNQLQPAYLTGCLLRAANRGVPPCLSRFVLLDVAQLRLRRPIHNKPSGYLRFAALATKPGEICGLGSRGRAAKRRNTHSLGRQPQVTERRLDQSPEGATDCGCGVSRSHHVLIVCRRFAARCFSVDPTLGLTPQAKNLTPQAMDMPPPRGWFKPSRRNAGSFLGEWARQASRGYRAPSGLRRLAGRPPSG